MTFYFSVKNEEYRIYSRNSRTFFNKNVVSKLRVRDLCEETILRRFIMKRMKINLVIPVIF